MWNFLYGEKAGKKKRENLLSSCWNKEQILLSFSLDLICKGCLQIKHWPHFSQFSHRFSGNHSLSKCLDFPGLEGQVSVEWKYISFLSLWLRAPWSNQAIEQRLRPFSCREWTTRWQSPFYIMTLTLVICNLWSRLLIRRAVGCHRAWKPLLPKRKKKKNH